MKNCILLVDDYPEMRSLVRLLLTSHFFCEIVEATSGAEAAHFLRTQIFCLVISDYEMNCGSGDWLYHHMKLRYPTTPLVIISSVFDRVRLPLDQTLRGILSKDKIVQLPRLLKDLSLENLTAV